MFAIPYWVNMFKKNESIIGISYPIYVQKKCEKQKETKKKKS